MPPVFAISKSVREGRRLPGCDSTCLDLIETGHRVRQLEEDFLRRHGLNHTRILILSLLCETPSGSLHAAELAERAGVSRSAMTCQADGLERLDLIRRVKDPHDRRAISIKITPAGETLVEQIHSARLVWMQWLDAAIGSADTENLRRLLRKVRTALDEVTFPAA